MHGVSRTTGKHLLGDEHLRQSVIDILTTPVGTRVLRRNYGSNLHALIDSPKDQSTRLNVIAATAGALETWEPRLVIHKVEVAFIDGGFDISVSGYNVESAQQYTATGIMIYGSQP